MDKKIEENFSNMVANLLQTELCKDFDSGLLHGFMGIASEAGELLNKYENTMEFHGKPFSRTMTLIELSDLLHYMQMIIGRLGSSISEILIIFNPPYDIPFRDEDVLNSCEYLNPVLLRGFIRLSSEAGELLNRYKKFLYYHGEPFTENEMLTMLSDLLSYMQMILDELDSSVEEIMCINMAKLKTRYPEGYTHDKAITGNRDKEAERRNVEAVIDTFASYREMKDLGLDDKDV